MEYSIQMYSLRDITEKNMDKALETVAAIGYKYVEFAGFFGHSADEINAMLDKYGLKLSGTHSSWTDLRDNFEETLAYHKAIGNKNYIVPGADLSTQEKLDEFVAVMNEAQVKLAKEGISLGYHNHSHEFLPSAYGKIIHDEIASRTNVMFEIDTYWAYNAKRDPVELLEKYKDRMNCIHIKDGLDNGAGKPLGMGTAPVAAVYEKAKELGMLMVVESETLTPSGSEEARICFEHLKTLEK
ncbi:MAG: sugar phosphate isomerase/epimerase [Clostridia bacterium]|nr:sugar phosphate isomerase/epimerase [Clostridia bacterium]